MNGFWWGLVCFCAGYLVSGVAQATLARLRAPRDRLTHAPTAHEDPVPAPEGWHWQVAESGLTNTWGTLYLVEDGRRIDRIGIYEGRAEGDWPPIPRWHASVDTERHLRRASIKLLQQRESEIARRARLEDVSRRIEEG